MLRRVTLLILVMLLLALPALAQEATPEAAGTPAIAPQACEQPGSLTMWVWDENWAEVIGQAIEAWQADYCPGAEVDLQVQPWGQYWDLLKTNVAGGDMPDVFNMSQDRFYFYASNDALLDLQPYFDEAGVDTSLWGSGMIDPYRWGDNQDLYAGPVNWDTIAIFYNKDLFDAAGVEYPTAEWTWDDFAEAAAALTDPENDVYGAAVYAEYQSGYPNWIAATGTTPIVEAGRTRCTLTDEGSLEALNFLKGLYDEGYMPSVSVVGGTSPDDAFNFWLAGKVAMVAGGSWKLPEAIEKATFDWDVVQLPRNPETGRSRSIVHSVGYVASANTENPDLAANLILYLVSDEGQKFFADAGGVAPANPALQQQWIDSFGDAGVNIQTFVDALQDSQGVTVFDEIWDKINTELVVNIFDQGMSVEDAANDACEFINTQLPEQAQ
ncbi:MAG: sugar ABC transporter substrate-binding protein [Chloroflexi bacterium]|nr:sugar ABC transporter substrate-binding protein [Chloroflexota bacterium]